MSIDQETLRAAIREELGLRDLGERTLDWDEAACILGCTTGTLKVWVSKKMVPFTKVNGLTRFRSKSLQDFLEKNSVPVEAA